MTADVITLHARDPKRPSVPTPEQRDVSLHAELRRARIRIAQLEASLTEATRDAVAHFERARAAERRLAELLHPEDADRRA